VRPSFAFVSFVLAGSWLLPMAVGAQTTFSSEKNIDGSFSRASALSVGLLDDDDAPDVFALGEDSDLVKVLLNGGDGSSWSSIDLPSGSRLRQTSLGDLDGDDDIDLVYTDFNDKRVYLLRNRLDEAAGFTRQTIFSGNDGRPDGIVVADVDLDTDLDVVSRRGTGTYLWHENLNGLGSSWAHHTIGTGAHGGRAVWAGDLDGDGGTVPSRPCISSASCSISRTMSATWPRHTSSWR